MVVRCSNTLDKHNNLINLVVVAYLQLQHLEASHEVMVFVSLVGKLTHRKQTLITYMCTHAHTHTHTHTPYPYCGVLLM